MIDLDIKEMFENIDHELPMRAVRIYVTKPWIVLYIEGWLKVPLKDADYNVTERLSGTSQRGVISSLLSNPFMHHTFDKRMKIN